MTRQMTPAFPDPAAAGMLASVTDCEEALIALQGGADIIDLKDPARGALGAVETQVVGAVIRAVGGRRPVSATIGDLTTMQPAELAAAARQMADCGVDYVKIGFFPAADATACLAALAPLAASGARLIAVLFADLGTAAFPLTAFAAAGFAGVMIDTAGKGTGSLRHHLDDEALRAFVADARRLRLLTGLAGSLRPGDIAPLLAIAPDYLGFRSALCAAGERTARLDAEAFAGIRRAIPAAVRAAA
jgi:uncharacterized protein (UPF0264 family)